MDSTQAFSMRAGTLEVTRVKYNGKSLHEFLREYLDVPDGDRKR